jgi:VIT1/CCC1 family predicted Fe2+/Mn2+ transporter
LYPTLKEKEFETQHGEVRMGSEVSTTPEKTQGMGWRVAVSIVTFFGSVIAAILWLFFYAASFNAYQNIAVIVVIILAFTAVMGATWAPWGMRQGASWSEKRKPEQVPQKA